MTRERPPTRGPPGDHGGAARLVVAIAALLVPRDQRAEWVEEWHAEIWHWTRDGDGRDVRGGASGLALAGRCLGAFPHAVWIRIGRWSVDGMWSSVRLSARALMRDRAFTVPAVAIFGLAVAAAATLWAAYEAVVLRALPYDEPGRLVAVWAENEERGWYQEYVAPANLFDWRDDVGAFADVAAYGDYSTEQILLEGGEAEVVDAGSVSGNLFDVLGVRPALGRTFRIEETWSDSEPVVVLGHAFWERRFGADPEVLGRSIDLSGVSYEIIGVMPEDFRYLAPDKEIWIPFRWAPDALSAAFFRRAHLVRAVARLRDGVGPEEALEELLGVAAGLEASYPETNTGLTAGITPLGDWLVGDRAVMLRALASAVAILLIAAAVNVGYLVLVRRKRREAELAIRRALGAGQSEIFSDAAAEAALVSLIGAGLGVLGSLWGMRWLASAAPPELLGSVEPTPSVSLVLLSVGIVAVSALFFTILPTRLGPATSGSAAMTPGSRAGTSSARARGIRGFVTVQVALSTVLIFSAALLTRSFVTLRSVDPGFDASGVLTFAVPFPDGSDEAAPERARAARQIVRDLEGLDGVVSAGAVRQLPVLGNGWTSFFSVEGRAPGEGSFEIAHRGADAGYFESMRVPLVAGRHVQDDEVGVVVVNETFARRAFGSSEALGQRIAFTEEPSESSTWWTVVGVVGDELQNGLRVEARPEVITPYTWDVPSTFRFVARTSGDPLALLPWARQVVRSIDASLPLDEVASLDGIVRDSLARDRFMTLVAGAFAFLAGLLAVAGVYGVTAQAAASWQREFALRLAVGARPANLFRSVLRRGAALVGGGLALGALLAVWSTRFIEAFLFETSGSDLPSLALVTLVIAISGLLATVPSALRAMRTDPARSLSP